MEMHTKYARDLEPGDIAYPGSAIKDVLSRDDESVIVAVKYLMEDVHMIHKWSPDDLTSYVTVSCPECGTRITFEGQTLEDTEGEE